MKTQNACLHCPDLTCNVRDECPDNQAIVEKKKIKLTVHSRNLGEFVSTNQP